MKSATYENTQMLVQYLYVRDCKALRMVGQLARRFQVGAIAQRNRALQKGNYIAFQGVYALQLAPGYMSLCHDQMHDHGPSGRRRLQYFWCKVKGRIAKFWCTGAELACSMHSIRWIFRDLPKHALSPRCTNPTCCKCFKKRS
jgi:hypothetical protein